MHMADVPHTAAKVARVISGGQTGADRGGLEGARRVGTPTGGWAPKGWLTERGADPSLAAFGLREHASPLYPPRTEANVLEADATLLLGRADGRGTSNTRALCARHGRPVWGSEIMARHDLLDAAGFVRNLPGAGLTLNVAGSRESRCPGLQERAAAFVAALLEEVAHGAKN